MGALKTSQPQNPVTRKKWQVRESYIGKWQVRIKY
jgi:hypothetical protein